MSTTESLSKGAQPELVELLRSVAAGDEPSFARLYDRTIGLVLSFAQRIVGDRELAEEAAHDVYLSIWKKAASFSEYRGSPSAWILAITRSRAIDRLRAERRHGSGATFEEALHSDAASHEDPSLETAVEERRDQVVSAVRGLPESQRRAIELAFFAGLSYSEVADRVGAPLGTVKTQIRRGMQKLRRELRAYEQPS